MSCKLLSVFKSQMISKSYFCFYLSTFDLVWSRLIRHQRWFSFNSTFHASSLLKHVSQPFYSFPLNANIVQQQKREKRNEMKCSSREVEKSASFLLTDSGYIFICVFARSFFTITQRFYHCNSKQVKTIAMLVIFFQRTWFSFHLFNSPHTILRQ